MTSGATLPKVNAIGSIRNAQCHNTLSSKQLVEEEVEISAFVSCVSHTKLQVEARDEMFSWRVETVSHWRCTPTPPCSSSSQQDAPPSEVAYGQVRLPSPSADD